MPILKTQILGSIVEINYETDEKQRLLFIIDKFNQRLKEFQKLEGQVSDKKIIYLAALKIENELKENNEKKSSYENSKYLAKENIELKDKINELNLEIKELKSVNLKALDEIDKIELKLNQLIKNILKSKIDEY
ncbi:MAG: hypothetical protein CFH18_00006 [Alphaproteobacteria bacterium MarineAlpha5_Bin8]|mgnify:CR=1 FL=1|nr:MAG: hypothetical protein CFH17_00374 [Alphaproteobacteria bacterium MarineAlpha5_Bin7]PPR48390.1 MAG: hypothetical protein CFH18_00006 [Alphaproteobacteria bacterium MarineAlpha5_Bin8]PPR54387.1 MAG: hypothetical protein CFH16_00420 [Alphaproteobacteria bacterium MarineAlpha5_Bin6]|tara:strand:- start:1432 stop:1833 length:402 start_codon:yes stop_codon:yes gene_type:complete